MDTLKVKMDGQFVECSLRAANTKWLKSRCFSCFYPGDFDSFCVFATATCVIFKSGRK